LWLLSHGVVYSHLVFLCGGDFFVLFFEVFFVEHGLGDKLPLLYQAYIPTVTCDIMYRWARGAVGDWLAKAMAQDTFFIKSFCFGLTVRLACIISFGIFARCCAGGVGGSRGARGFPSSRRPPSFPPPHPSCAALAAAAAMACRGPGGSSTPPAPHPVPHSRTLQSLQTWLRAVDMCQGWQATFPNSFCILR